jgi:hypothetical protein
LDFDTENISPEHLLIGLVKMFQTDCLAENSQKRYSSILPEKLAIILCSAAVAALTFPILIGLHTLSAIFWGTLVVCQLLNGKLLLHEDDEL